MALSRFGIVLSLAHTTQAWSSYQQRIPNGANVKVNGVGWPGVGHLASGGGGARNAFGAAFQSAGLAWTTSLCQADSDGDGETNGEELGDPSCTWKQGQSDPVKTSGTITHPGLAESNSLPPPVPPTPAPVMSAQGTPPEWVIVGCKERHCHTCWEETKPGGSPQRVLWICSSKSQTECTTSPGGETTRTWCGTWTEEHFNALQPTVVVTPIPVPVTPPPPVPAALPPPVPVTAPVPVPVTPPVPVPVTPPIPGTVPASPGSSALRPLGSPWGASSGTVPAPAVPPPSKDDGGSNIGMILGIVFGILAALGLVGGAAVVVSRRNAAQFSGAPSTDAPAPMYHPAPKMYEPAPRMHHPAPKMGQGQMYYYPMY